MELQEILQDALRKRFKQNAIIKAIEKEIKDMAEKTTLNKYKDNILFVDGLEFELGGVKAHVSHWGDCLTLNEVELRLAYFCKSKLPKEKREKLKKVKDKYKESDYLEWNTYKIAIWRELMYTIDIENILSGEINLSIDI